MHSVICSCRYFGGYGLAIPSTDDELVGSSFRFLCEVCLWVLLLVFAGALTVVFSSL